MTVLSLPATAHRPVAYIKTQKHRMLSLRRHTMPLAEKAMERCLAIVLVQVEDSSRDYDTRPCRGAEYARHFCVAMRGHW